MNKEDLTYGYGPYKHNKMSWENMLFLEQFEESFERVTESYDFLSSYSTVFNLYTASTPQPNPFSNKAMFIIDTLNKLGIKYSVDIFTYEGGNLHWGSGSTSHKLINIIAEPNPNATGPAIVFCAHHDVANVRSENCQDNGASVCNLLRLGTLINKAQEESKRTILLFTDCEESGAKGAKRFVSNATVERGTGKVTHNVYGEIESVINLELTGKGRAIWSDCDSKKQDVILHESLENILGKTIPKLRTPPSDALTFRKQDFPVLCIGTLPEEDLEDKETWRICHSMKDTISGCNREDMKVFTEFLFNITKINTKPKTDADNNGDVKTQRALPT